MEGGLEVIDEQINVAIAKACGWEVQLSLLQSGLEIVRDGKRKPLPNYCNDLNAMHQAEKVLTYEQSEVFSNKVADVVQAVNHKMDYPFPWHFARIHATARQRAEALLETLGLRKEATDKDSLTVEGATTEECSEDQKEVQK